MKDILNILEQNSRLSNDQIAVMTGQTEKQVSDKIASLEADGTIAGYSAFVDWDKIGTDKVSAIIELRVTPQKDMGFDKVAKLIAANPEVKSVYLMSGGFDLLLLVDGGSMREVAMFVSSRLATIEGVSATATHFVMKKYKDHGKIFSDGSKDDRRYVGL